jgi:catechol 2,3-dioxygenase-like lactoylglutathione lyase family enzyme
MAETDERPPLAFGHIVLAANDVDETTRFMLDLGMRNIFQSPEVVVLELRGGTHLLIEPTDSPVTPGTKAPFDLMVDDIDACRDMVTQLGLQPSDLEKNEFHRLFTITDPSGYEITINSSHASQKPV